MSNEERLMMRSEGLTMREGVERTKTEKMSVKNSEKLVN